MSLWIIQRLSHWFSQEEETEAEEGTATQAEAGEGTFKGSKTKGKKHAY